MHFFTNNLWLLLHAVEEWSNCNKDHMTLKAENIYSLDLYRNHMPTSVLQNGGLDFPKFI